MKSPDPARRRAGLIYDLVNRVIVFFLLIVLTFALPRLMPGDPLSLLLSSDVTRELTAAETEALRRDMGLAGSWADQFFTYFRAVLSGDLGYSFHHAAPVSRLLATALPWTGLLVLGAIPLYLVVGVFAGIEAGRVPHRRFDRVATGLMTVLASLPPFTVAVFLLLIFAVLWPVLPLGGAQPIFPAEAPLARSVEILRHALLPTVALAAHEIVRFYFLSRGEAVALSARPFLINARARGISGWRERIDYYGRNLLPVILARMSDSITVLVGAVLYVEVVFSYPGIGHLILGAIMDRDYTLLQGAVLGLSVLVLSLNWLIDVAATLLARRG